MPVIEKGSVFVPCWGKYSDYEWACVLRAKETFDTDHLIEEWFRRHPELDEGGWNDSDTSNQYAFVAWLIQSERAEEIPSFEWHFHQYGFVKGNSVSSIIVERTWWWQRLMRAIQ